MIAEARLGTERVMWLLRVRDDVPELAADRVRDVVDGTATRRTVPDVRGRDTVGRGLVARGLDGVLERTDLVGAALRELGAAREREGAGELRDGAAALSSLLELPLRLREVAATTARRGNKSDFPSIEKDRCPEVSCASALMNPTPEGKNINAPASTTTILFIGFALLSTSCLIIALQLKGPQVVLDLSLFSTGEKLMLFNAPLLSDGSRPKASWTFLLKTTQTGV